MDIQHYMKQLGEQARAASRLMAKADTNTKNQALRNIAALIRQHEKALLVANQQDGRRQSQRH